jgi:flagellar protein FlgJ
MNPLAAISPAAAPAASPSPERAKLAATARQFEAIFVRQMLAEARKAQMGNDLFGGQGMDTFRAMQDERFADIAAERGSFGLARMIEAQLARQVPTESPSRLREGSGEGLFSSLSQQAHPQPLPQAGGESAVSGPSGGGG